jgi:hypothetical protein
MRWEDLFAELDHQWDAALEAERQAEVVERTRAELAKITLLDRVRGSVGRDLRIQTVGGVQLSGTLARVAADCLLLASDRAELLVPVGAVEGLTGLLDRSVPDNLVGVVDLRLGMASMLRALARNRAAVTVDRRSAPSVHGTPVQVGADFIDLAEHAVGEPARSAAVRTRVVVPFAAILVVRRGA